MEQKYNVGDCVKVKDVYQGDILNSYGETEGLFFADNMDKYIDSEFQIKELFYPSSYSESVWYILDLPDGHVWKFHERWLEPVSEIRFDDIDDSINVDFFNI